jgi:hypothetical protein
MKASLVSGISAPVDFEYEIMACNLSLLFHVLILYGRLSREAALLIMRS